MLKLSYNKLMGLCFLITSFAQAMQEEEFGVSHEIFLDGGSTRENIGNLNFAQIGVYATPYHMAIPLLAIQSKHIIDALPEALLKTLASTYALSGGPQELQKELYHKVATQELSVAVVLWKGLAFQPSVYNAVFHPTVGSWLGLNYTASFNVNINAGIFYAQGVRPAPDSSVAFDVLGPLAINRHDIDNYSPNNGKFALEAGRAVATFWLMGAYNGRATVSYNVLLLQPTAQKEVQEVAGVLADTQRQLETNKRMELAKADTITDPQQKQQALQEIKDRYAQLQNPVLEIEQLITSLERIVKKLESEGKNADSSALYGTVELLRMIYAARFPVQQTQPAQSTPQQAPSLTPPPPPAKPLRRPSGESVDVQNDLELLNVQLRSLDYALRA